MRIYARRGVRECKDLLRALRLAEKYLEHSRDIHCEHAVYKQPQTVLREQADKIDQKDKDIVFIRDMIDRHKAFDEEV